MLNGGSGPRRDTPLDVELFGRSSVWPRGFVRSFSTEGFLVMLMVMRMMMNRLLMMMVLIIIILNMDGSSQK